MGIRGLRKLLDISDTNVATDIGRAGEFDPLDGFVVGEMNVGRRFAGQLQIATCRQPVVIGPLAIPRDVRFPFLLCFFDCLFSPGAGQNVVAVFPLPWSRLAASMWNCKLAPPCKNRMW